MSQIYIIPENCICRNCAHCSVRNERDIFCSHPDINDVVPETTEECDLFKPTEV